MSNLVSADLVLNLADTLPPVERSRLVSLLTGAAAPKPPPKLLTVDAVASLWGCTPRTVHNWITAGEVTAIKRGRLIRVTEDSLYNHALRGGK